MLTAEENVVLPLDIAGEKVDREWLEDSDHGRDRGRRKHRPSDSPAASSSASRSRGRSSRTPQSSSPTSHRQPRLGDVEGRPPRAAQRRRRPRPDDGDGPHDAGAASMADRILFLADGRIVKDIHESTAREVIAAMQEVTGR